MLQEKRTKKLSRHARYNKKRKIEREQNSMTSPVDNIKPSLTMDNIESTEPTLTTNQHRSVSLCSLDLVTSKEVKVTEKVSTRELLIETLIQEAMHNSSSHNNKISNIPSKFLKLVDKEIIKTNQDEVKFQANASNKELWIAFGCWLGFKEPVVRRDVRRHLRSKWMELKHVFDSQKDKSQNAITKQMKQIEKTQSACNNISSLNVKE